jgi:signal transduction histidine kinase/ligand-binding sensor domain-containing protein
MADSASRSPAAVKWFVLAGTLTAILIGASFASAERLIVRTYTVADGLPTDNVNCVVTDRDGFLWICTTAGLARFDGTRFATYRVDSGLPDPVVNHFLHTPSGRWAATNGGGVARLEAGMPDRDGRVFTAFAVGTTPRSMRVNVLYETHDGTLLAGTDGGLFRGRADAAAPRFELVPLDVPGIGDGSLQVWAIAEGAAGRLWVGTSGGLVFAEGWDRRAHIPVAPMEGADHVFAIVPDAAGRLWLGHDAGLVVWLPPAPRDLSGTRDALIDGAGPCAAATRTATAAPSLPEAVGSACHWRPADNPQERSRIWDMLQTAEGWLWMSTSTGLSAFDGTGFHRFDESRGLPSTEYRTAAIDPGGDLWIASARGADRIHRRGFTYFTADDGVVGSPRRIFRGPDGELYGISAVTTAVLRFDDARWTAVQPRLPPLLGIGGRSGYGAALVDRSGSWWIGTGSGLVRFPAVERIEELAGIDPVAHYTTANGLAGNDIWHLFEDAHGDVWIATRIPGADLLTRWDRRTGRFHRYGVAQGLPAERAVRAFAEDRSGALWVSLWDGGLARFDGRRFQLFEAGTDIPPGPRGHMLLDRRGRLWVGGLEIVYSPDPTAAHPEFRTFRTVGGSTVPASALGEDSDGWIYAGSQTGVVRFLPGDDRLQQLGAGGLFAVLTSNFHRDEDGTMWSTHNDGVLRYEPHHAGAGGAPPVWIGGVAVAGVPQAVPAMGAAELAPIRVEAGRQIRIDYFGLGFGAYQPLRFQIRLEGPDNEWSRPTSQPTVLLAGLGPGRYRFQVRGVSASGQTTPEAATVAFIVPPPVWLRGWFLASLATALAAALTLAHRLRVRRLVEIEHVRTRIAADLHDDLGASLARVSLLAEAIRRKLRDSPDAAERMLDEIGETSRSLIAAAGDIAYSIDPGRGGLDALAARVRRFAEDLLTNSGVQWSFRVDDGAAVVVFSSDQRRHLLAILKEALRNAVRHGRPGRVTLTLAVRDAVFEAELVDDGRGFAPDAAGRATASGGGHGLRNLQARASELGGVLEIDSRPGSGTRVTLTVPLRHA